MAARPVRIPSLCSGAGMLDVAIRAAVGTARTVCYVENSVEAASVLAARMEAGALDAGPVWSDLRTFDASSWRGVVDIVIGGFPCQGFSFAGKRLGEDDPRHLWPDIARILGECKPEWAFFENSPGLISLGFDVVRSDLADLGYRVEAGICDAEEVGAPHLRQRLFWLAHAEGVQCGSRREAAGERSGRPASGCDVVVHATSLPQREQDDKASTKPRQNTWENAGRRRDFLVPPDELFGGSGKPEKGGGGLRPLFPPARSGGDDAWRAVLNRWPHFAPALEPSVSGVADGATGGLDLSRTEKLRIGGNGVVALCAAFAFAGLVDKMNNNQQQEETHGTTS